MHSRSLPLAASGFVAVSAAVWTAVIGGFAVWRHNEFLSHRFDLGNMVQAVWSTTQGRPLEFTDAATGDQVARLAAHVDPILVLLAPLWLVFPDPEMLILVQAAALASGAYPVARLAMKYLSDARSAVLVALWYLAFPWVVWTAFNDFHPVALAIPLLLYAFWFLDEHRFLQFALCCGLALMTGELVGLTVAALGISYALRYRRYWTGALIATVGVTWTTVCVAFVVPAFNAGRPSRYYERFESVGGSPLGVLETVFTDPSRVMSHVSNASDVEYVGALLAPTVGLALGAPLVALVALPQLLLNLLSDWWSTTQPTYHYGSALLPAIIAASIVALARLPKATSAGVASALLFAAVAVLVSRPPIPGGDDFVFAELESPAKRAAMRSAVDLIPPGAGVSSTNRLGAHLSERQTIHLFPRRDGTEWVVLDLANTWLEVAGEQSDPAHFRRLIAEFDRDPRWTRIFDRSGVRVYRRAS